MKERFCRIGFEVKPDDAASLFRERGKIACGLGGQELSECQRRVRLAGSIGNSRIGFVFAGQHDK